MANAVIRVHDGPALAQAAHALERHRIAKASGDALAIAAARRDIEHAQDALLRVKAEARVLGEIAKALGNGRKITWRDGLTP
jgi:hypothetical protein